MGDSVEVGQSSAIGIRCEFQHKSKVGPFSSVGHGVVLGQHSEIGPYAYIGVRTTISDRIKIPSGTTIPAHSKIETQGQADEYYSKEAAVLAKERVKLLQEFSKLHHQDFASS
jgi:UDP-3-O-[3-hydroxymyristoyl] glucosamine N-acyltransferase